MSEGRLRYISLNIFEIRVQVPVTVQLIRIFQQFLSTICASKQSSPSTLQQQQQQRKPNSLLYYRIDTRGGGGGQIAPHWHPPTRRLTIYQAQSFTHSIVSSLSITIKYNISPCPTADSQEKARIGSRKGYRAPANQSIIVVIVQFVD